MNRYGCALCRDDNWCGKSPHGLCPSVQKRFNKRSATSTACCCCASCCDSRCVSHVMVITGYPSMCCATTSQIPRGNHRQNPDFRNATLTCLFIIGIKLSRSIISRSVYHITGVILPMPGEQTMRCSLTKFLHAVMG